MNGVAVFDGSRGVLVVRELSLDQWRTVEISPASASSAREDVLSIYRLHALRFQYSSRQGFGAGLGSRGQRRGRAARRVGAVGSSQLPLRDLRVPRSELVRLRRARIRTAAAGR